MQHAPRYDDVVAEVRAFLSARVKSAEEAGISRQRMVVDPGFGFGKTIDHNLTLLKHLASFDDIGLPVMVGLSRKSMLGHITGRGIKERVHASVAAALLAAERGARIIRVHDVRATKDALRVHEAVRNAC